MKNKKTSEDNEINGNNYIFSKNDNKKENMIGPNPGDVNHSIDFSKAQNKIDLNPNMNISGAFSEKNNDDNYLKGANNNKKMEKLISN